MIIGETGVLSTHPSRGEWLINGYEALYERFPRLAGIVYFDFNMTDVFGKRLESGNWQIETDPDALAGYRALARDPRFQGDLTEPEPAPVTSPLASLPIPTAFVPTPSPSVLLPPAVPVVSSSPSPSVSP
jgi:hypothetical protein